MRPPANDGPIFEIHLTVGLSESELDAFCAFCRARQWRPLHIVLDRGATASQPMATIHGRGDEPAGLDEMRRAADVLLAGGWNLVRRKLEFPIDAPGVPEELPDAPGHGGRYYEHHLKLRAPVGGPAPEMAELARGHGAHWSRNALKRFADGFEHRFVTLRHSVGSRARSLRACDALIADLALLRAEIVKRESEYCASDSRSELDAGWLPDEGRNHV